MNLLSKRFGWDKKEKPQAHDDKTRQIEREMYLIRVEIEELRTEIESRIGEVEKAIQQSK